MTVRVYGSLKKKDLDLSQVGKGLPQQLGEFIDGIGLPRSSVKLAMINHCPVRADATVKPDDHVALFPQEYPFFADWKDFWRQTERQHASG